MNKFVIYTATLYSCNLLVLCLFKYLSCRDLHVRVDETSKETYMIPLPIHHNKIISLFETVYTLFRVRFFVCPSSLA